MLALELIDTALTLAERRDEAVDVVREEPGMAVLGDAVTWTGSDAAQRVRVQPLLAQTNFWRGLSVAPLNRPSRHARTCADVAFAQVSALLEPYRGRERVLLAVPAGYTREQLGLLLGVVNETGVPVAGLVDAALAACSMEAAPARVLCLDLELHQALLTVLEYTGGERPGLRRSRYEIAPGRGVLALQQTWMQFLAEQFVRKTRFDPLHHATTEQELVNRLPQWLQEFTQQERITTTMRFGERDLELEVERADMIAAVEAHYAELVRLVQDARVAGMPIELRLSHRLAALPGLHERLAELRDCEVRVLPRAAAALGALQYETAIQRPPEQLALVYQLPVPRASDATVTPDVVVATPPQLRPTHVLFRGRAWRITEQPLTVGWSVSNGARSLTLPSAAPGVSRAHCTLVRRNGAVVVEDHSTYGSFVNEERVVGHAALTVGDRLRLGAPGLTLELIQLVDDHGAPQD